MATPPAATASSAHSSYATQWFDLEHEDLVADPAKWLCELCSFIGVEADDTYLADCSGIVYTRPHRSRYEVPWSEELIADVTQRMAAFSFLEGYRFEERTADG